MHARNLKRHFVRGRVASLVLVSVALVLGAVAGCQQRHSPPARPTVAVLPIEATDSRAEIRDLADHLGKRLRLLLASRPEVRVLEYRSSNSTSIYGLSVEDKAQALAADYLLSGTLGGLEQNLRLSLQLYAQDGAPLWNDTFVGPVDYQEQFQGWVLDELVPRLPFAEGALEGMGGVLESCAYPGDTVAILTLARVGRRGGDSATLAMVAAGHEDASLLHLAKSKFYFDQVPRLSPTERPVIQKLGMQSLGLAARACPDYPDIELLRLIHNGELTLANGDDVTARHPNSAELYLALAELHAGEGQGRKAEALAQEALRLDPLGDETRCRVQRLLAPADSAPGDCD